MKDYNDRVLAEELAMIFDKFRNNVNNPLDVSVNNSIDWNVWSAVFVSVLNSASNSAGHFVRDTINNAMNEYEY